MLALVPVGDAQHLLAVVVIAAAFAPQIGRLDRRHQDFEAPARSCSSRTMLLDLVQHALAQRQPG
jgi:hypothetical protein